MRRAIPFLAVAALAISAARASAQQSAPQPAGYYDSHAAMTEVDALRADFDDRIADLQRQLDAVSVEGGGGNGCCDPCCRGAGWFGSAQAVWLKPHKADGTGFANDPDEEKTVPTDYEVTPRLELGYACSDGRGWRVRYWEFDHAFSQLLALGNETVIHGWDTWVGDIEYTDSTRLGCNWDATFSVGFRHVEYTETLAEVEDTDADEFQTNFTGYGLTTSLELRRSVSCNWGLFAGARASALYGDEDLRVTESDDPDQFVHQENNVKYIWEAQAGVEWIRCIPCGGYVYARGFGEVQYWDSFGQGGLGDDDNIEGLLADTAAGFAGFGFSLGVVR